MTDAERALLDLIMRPEFSDRPATPEIMAARRAVALERLPEGFKEQLAIAAAEADAAEMRLRDLGRQHPAICYGSEGLIMKLRGHQ